MTPTDSAPPGTHPGRHVGFGEERRLLNYGSYLKVTDLLGLQRCLTDAHDEMLFIIVHQAYELWFKQLLHELEGARSAMDATELGRARHRLRRVAVIERLLVQQVDVLETMTPQDFLSFRSELAPASGFQSIQFREIEFLSGLKDPGYLERLDMDPDERQRLERRLEEPSLWDAFLALMERLDMSALSFVFDQGGGRGGGGLFELSEGLLDHDEAFALWRSRHVLMVERQIGTKTGTGGSIGAPYLRSTLGKRFFPDLWAARSAL